MTLLTKQQIEALLDGTTPGPWLREAQGIYADNGYKLIASVKSHEQGIAWPTTEANGNLIAAAPAIARTALDALARLEEAEASTVGGPMWCDGCRATGAVHCAHPDQCGNMLSATAAADQWKAWLDDLPLPFTFDRAIGRLQDFITALTTRIDVPQPADPSGVEALAALRAERDEAKRLMEMRHREVLAADALMRKHQRRAEAAEAERDAALTRLAAAEAQVGVLTEALEKIEAWRQFPRSGRFWPNEDGTVSDQEMSYSAAFGSNGERDFMRGIARAALAAVTPPEDGT